jgi:hypothetical protein
MSVTSPSTPLPPNVHISTHPCIQAKISQLRNLQISARDSKALIHEIATMVACEALAYAFTSVPDGSVSIISEIPPASIQSVSEKIKTLLYPFTQSQREEILMHAGCRLRKKKIKANACSLVGYEPVW